MLEDKSAKAIEDYKESSSALKVRQQLEAGLIHNYYGQDKEALQRMESAQKESGFVWSLTGALGRRTKFQTFDVSQLVVLAESKREEKKMNRTRKKVTNVMVT
ncbi:hypothetical protein G6F57_022829 [Rhizopus arrhizus]|nr:hypothetical protein G6F57_022829 [Rhizopus arrhizus]